MDTKVCTKCGISYPATDEYFLSLPNGKLRSSCRSCNRKYMKEYNECHKEEARERYAKNRERILEWKREYHREHKEQEREYGQEYYQKNRERRREYNKQYYEKNKQKELERGKKYREENHEQLLEKNRRRKFENREQINARRREIRNLEKDKEYYRNHLEYYRAYQHRYSKEHWREYYYKNPEKFAVIHSRRRGDRVRDSAITREQWETTLQYFDGSCAYCGRNTKIEMDHFYPLALGGHLEYGNVVPACKSCNSSKNDRLFSEWYRDKDFYSTEREQRILAFTGGNE